MTHRKKGRGVAFALLCMGQLMCILDLSIVNIAIPSMQSDLGLASSAVHWIITAYVLTYGGFLLVGGRMGDLFGRRRVFLVGLSLFTLASALGGIAAGPAPLLIARAGQGLGGALITPTVMSFTAWLYAEGRERNRALGLLGAINGAGFALGLILGGLLTSMVGWRWIFFINLPIGAVALVLSLLLLPETERAKQSVNLLGAMLATGGLALAVYTLATIEEAGILSLRTGGFLLVTVVLLLLFTLVERRSDQPLIPAGLLRHLSLVRALVGSATFGLVVNPCALLLTLYLQNISGMDPWQTGLAFLPQEAAVFLAANLAGRCVSRYGSRNVLVAGIVCFALSSVLFAQITTAPAYLRFVLPGLLFMGFGIGSVNVAGSIAATEGLPTLQHGISTGIWNTGNQIGTGLGMAILSTIASSSTRALVRAGHGLDQTAATVAGFRVAFLVALGFALLGCILLVVLGLGKEREPVWKAWNRRSSAQRET